jgi:DNA mismatch repair ATPase MutL
MFTLISFEPAGIVVGHDNVKMANSVVDAIFRILAVEYLADDELAQIKLTEERKAEILGLDDEDEEEEKPKKGKAKKEEKPAKSKSKAKKEEDEDEEEEEEEEKPVKKGKAKKSAKKDEEEDSEDEEEDSDDEDSEEEEEDGEGTAKNANLVAIGDAKRFIDALALLMSGDFEGSVFSRPEEVEEEMILILRRSIQHGENISLFIYELARYGKRKLVPLLSGIKPDPIP